MKGIAPITPKSGTQAFRSVSQLPPSVKMVVVAGGSMPSGGPANPVPNAVEQGINAENPAQ